MARKPRVHDTVTAEEPERVPVYEAPAVEVQLAGKTEPAHLAVREAAVALRDAFGRITSGDRLAMARRGLNEVLEIALGKD